MKQEILNLVSQICNTESTNCRGLDKIDLARKLMDIANIPQNADIQEIPLDFDNQVVILFLMPNDNNYYSLFSGIGNDGNFYFELSITGKLQNDNTFDFYTEEQILSIDYFVKENVKLNTEFKHNDCSIKIQFTPADKYGVDRHTITINKPMLPTFKEQSFEKTEAKIIEYAKQLTSFMTYTCG